MKSVVNNPLSLRSNFTWILLGNIIYMGSQWLMVVVLAKLSSPKVVGQFTLGLAITAPVFLLTNLQLRTVQATDTKTEYKFNDYLGLRIVTTFIALLFIILIVSIVNYPIDTSIVILMIGLAKAFEALSDIVYGLMQKYERMDRIALSRMIKGPITLLTLGLLYWKFNSLFLSVLGMAVVWLFLFITYDYYNARKFEKIRLKISVSLFWKLTKLALPLGIVLMLSSLNTNIPRYLVEFFLGEEALGYFASIAYLMVAGNTVINALGQSATPRLSKYFIKGEVKKYQILLFKLIGIVSLLGIAGWLIALFFGKKILSILYTIDYAQHADIFSIVMLAAAINYVGVFLGYGMTAARIYKIQPYLGILWVFTSILGSLLLIPDLGMRGAAYTLLFSSIIQLISNVVVVVLLIKKKSKAL